MAFKNNLPKHVAIIMDGNGRWATDQNKPRAFGHHKGVDRVHEVVKCAREIGIQFLTLFAFSSDNWKRPAHEVAILMKLMSSYSLSKARDLASADIAVKFVGDRTRLNKNLLNAMLEMEQVTKAGGTMLLQVAIDYNGKAEIVRAVNRVLHAEKNQRTFSEISETEIQENLDTHLSPSVDLLIRTGDECRLSGFLLWQVAQAEICFCKKMWPDYTSTQFLSDLEWYRQRERRFGAVSSTVE